MRFIRLRLLLILSEHRYVGLSQGSKIAMIMTGPLTHGFCPSKSSRA